MRGRPIGRVEDFTIPFLVSFYFIVLMGLIALWAMFDFLIALTVACAVHIYLTRKLVAHYAEVRQTGP